MTGDLISRDALLENYGLKDATKYGNKTVEQTHNSYSTLMLYEVADMIEDAPAVDAEPVRHGRWVFGEDIDIQCSECGMDALIWTHRLQVRSNYCPNCGAKMDGGGKE